MSGSRNSEISRIYNVLTENNNLILNINGAWGIGKTFVSEKVERKINEEEPNCMAFRINLTDYDHYDDPLIPFIIVILDHIKNFGLKDEKQKERLRKLFAVAISVVPSLLKLVDPTGISGATLETVGEIFKGNDKGGAQPSSLIESNLANVKSYQSKLAELANAINTYWDEQEAGKFIIFIDDFDRANPQFSFKILNMIHQFKKLRVKLKFCTIMNRQQFENQLIKIYGPLSDDEHYLTKYIDLEITIENPCKNLDNIDDYKKFLQEIGIDNKLQEIIGNERCKLVVQCLSVRELNGKFNEVTNIFQKYCSNHLSRDSSYDDNVYYLVFLTVLFVKFELSFQSVYYELFTIKQIQTLRANVRDSNLGIYAKANFQQPFNIIIECIGLSKERLKNICSENYDDNYKRYPDDESIIYRKHIFRFYQELLTEITFKSIG